ncbi:MAG: YbgC/FadM family acyl-CoA thioesterase [Thalassobaculaceae bacterium]
MADRQAGMGRMNDLVHCFPIRVYYEDTDAQGMVYYANYLRFAERARTEMLRLVGAAHQWLIDSHDAGFSVRHLTAAYHAPARLDDLLEVRSEVTAARGAVLSLSQNIFRPPAPTPLVAMTLDLACLNGHGRPRRLPPVLLRALDAPPPS